MNYDSSNSEVQLPEASLQNKVRFTLSTCMVFLFRRDLRNSHRIEQHQNQLLLRSLGAIRIAQHTPAGTKPT